MQKYFLFFIFLFTTVSLFSEEINIAFLYSEKKFSKSYSEEIITMAENFINKNEVNNGKHFNILKFKNTDIIDKTELYNFLLNANQIKAILTYDYEDKELQKFANTNRIVLLNVSSKTKAFMEKEDYIYNINYSIKDIGESIADFAIDKLQAYKAVIINSSSKDDEFITKCFKQKYQSLDGEVLKEYNYSFSQRDFDDYFQEISRLNPDIIFIPYSLKIRTIISAAENYGLKLNFITDKIDRTMIYTKRNSVYGFSNFYVNLEDEKILAFRSLFNEKFNVFPDNSLLNLYDSVILLSSVINDSKDLKELTIKDKLDNLNNFQGINSTIHYFKDSYAIKDANFIKIDNGEKKLYAKNVHLKKTTIKNVKNYKKYRDVYLGISPIDLLDIYNESLDLIQNETIKIYTLKDPSSNIRSIDFYFFEDKLFKIKSNYFDILDSYKKIVLEKFIDIYGSNYISLENELENYQWRYQSYKINLYFKNDNTAFADFVNISIY